MKSTHVRYRPKISGASKKRMDYAVLSKTTNHSQRMLDLTKIYSDLSPLLHAHAIYLLIGVVLIAFLLGLADRWIKQNLWKKELRQRKLLNRSEQEFFHLLLSVLPSKIILTQVSYNALVTAKRRAVRARFNRLYADFVICDPKDFSVEAIVELDGPTHWTSEGKQKDEKRDGILKSVGYRVERFSLKTKPKREDIVACFHY